MADELTPREGRPVELTPEEEERIRSFLEQADSANTRRAYAADWRDFEGWCARRRRSPLPAAPETVAAYLSERAEQLKVSTLQRRLATIARVHRPRNREAVTRCHRPRRRGQSPCLSGP